jgi:hypothetical protein
MIRNDIDLDIYSLAEQIPEGDVVFYFRASESDEQDFLYAKGDLQQMGEVLGVLMCQNKDLHEVISCAAEYYLDNLETI